MKKCLFLLVFYSTMLQAQTVQISGYAGYTTDAALKVTHGRYLFGGSPNYGIIISCALKKKDGVLKNVLVCLQYDAQHSELSYRQYNTDKKFALGKTITRSILGGVIKEFKGGRIEPYGGLSMGYTFFSPEKFDFLARTSFSCTGGLKMSLTRFLSLKLQAQLIMPLLYNNVYVSWEPAVGLSTDVAPNGAIFLAGFTGGICFLIQ